MCVIDALVRLYTCELRYPSVSEARCKNLRRTFRGAYYPEIRSRPTAVSASIFLLFGDMPSIETWSGVSRLILGSTSWSRSHLLRTLNPPDFETIAPDIDERSIHAPTPQALVLSIGLAKAAALLPRIKTSPDTYLIVGDSVVTHKSSVLGKPTSADHARQILKSYATAPATTVSSVVVIDVSRRLYWGGVSEAEVYFRAFPDDVIEELIESGGAMQSAGGLRVENPIVERYTDCILGEKSAVMGFSTSLCERLIKEAVSGVGGKQI